MEAALRGITQDPPSVKMDEADGMPSIAATYIMDDDLESAEGGLANGNSSFHKVRQILPLGCLASRLMALGMKFVG